MSVRQAVSIVKQLVEEGEPALEVREGSTVATDLAALIEVRLGQESPYPSLWADFQADPEGVEPQLIGALEALIEADPAFGQRLEGFVHEWFPTADAPATRANQALQDALGRAKAWGRTAGLEPDPDVGQGEYLYGNLEPGAVTLDEETGQAVDQIEGVDHVERLGPSPARVRQLRTDLYAAVETFPGMDRTLRQDLEAELAEAIDEAARGELADAERLGRHLRNIGRMQPDILRVLVDRLDDPEAGWGRIEREKLGLP